MTIVCCALFASYYLHHIYSNQIISSLKKIVINYSKFVLLQIAATIVSLMLLQIAAGGTMMPFEENEMIINRIFGRRKYTHTGVNKTYAISLL